MLPHCRFYDNFHVHELLAVFVSRALLSHASNRINSYSKMVLFHIAAIGWISWNGKNLVYLES